MINKPKKQRKCVQLFMALFLFFFLQSSRCAQADVLNQLEFKKEVPIDKVWTITFNEAINFESVDEDKIYILDEAQNIVHITMEKGETDNTVKVKANKLYEYGKEYEIFVQGNILSKNNKTLNYECSMKFKTIENFNIETRKFENGSINNISRTKEDIIERWKECKPKFEGEKYSEEPQINYPHKTGKLNKAFVEDGLNAINFARYLVNLPDDIFVDDSLNKRAQHGAVLLANNGYLSHGPEKPTNMDEDFYKEGYESTSSSNIGQGYRSIADSIIDGYMDDGDSSNIDRVGHRRWILNPKFLKTGFGFAEKDYSTFTTTQVFDKSRSENITYDYVAWPNNGYFPIEIFQGNDPWSISFNPDKYSNISLDNIKVEFKNLLDGSVNTFDKSDNVFSHDRDYFNVNNNWYGVPNSVIFRPVGIENYKNGDKFQVTVKGLKDMQGNSTEITYIVEFFSMKK